MSVMLIIERVIEPLLHVSGRKHASCIFKVQAKNEVKVTWNLLKCTSTGYFFSYFVWRMFCGFSK